MAISGAAIVAVVAAVAAAGVSAYAAVKQGEAADKAARFNAKMAEREAEQKRQASLAAADDARRKHERTMAAQRARYGAAGVQLEEGSPLLVMMASEEEAALDVARIKHGGREAAAGLEAEANLQRFQGKQARKQGYLAAGASVLRGVSSAASIYGGASGGGGGAASYSTSAGYQAQRAGERQSYS